MTDDNDKLVTEDTDTREEEDMDFVPPPSPKDLKDTDPAD